MTNVEPLKAEDVLELIERKQGGGREPHQILDMLVVWLHNVRQVGGVIRDPESKHIISIKSKEVHGPFPFGFHVGGIDAAGVVHDIPEGAELMFGPPGKDGLPDVEYLAYERVTVGRAHLPAKLAPDSGARTEEV